MHVAGQLSPEEFAEHLEHMFSQVRESFGTLPAWAPNHWSGRTTLGEWILHRGPHSLAFESDDGGQLEVRTSFGDPRLDVTTLFQRELAATGRPIPFADFELPTPDRIVDIAVDGSPEPFEVWDGPAITRAAASVRGCALSLESRGLAIQGLELISVRDLEPFIAGSAKRIRALRSEP
jgi:hypothetical protein